MMKRLHIIGRKNHGKTTLIAELVAHWRAFGLRVGTIKHTHHQHELDTPGKDSFRHREAGAAVVGILTRSLNAVFWEPPEPEEAADPYSGFAPLFADCDVVLVEGDIQTPADKLEVWRADVGSPPLAAEDPSILAVITDDPVHLPQRILRRSAIPELAQWILDHINEECG